MSYAWGLRLITALVLLMWAAACGGGVKTKTQVPKHVPLVGASRTSPKFSIQVVVANGANQDSPIQMDFVAVADKNLLADVERLPAKDWFERRVQMQRDYAATIQVVSWEWVPGQHAGPISLDISSKTLAAFLFANYSNGGEHRVSVDLRTPVVVTLGLEDFSLQQLK